MAARAGAADRSSRPHHEDVDQHQHLLARTSPSYGAANDGEDRAQDGNEDGHHVVSRSLRRQRILCATMFAMFGYMFGYWQSVLPMTKERLHVDDARFGLLLLADDGGSFFAQAVAVTMSSVLRARLLAPVTGFLVVIAAGLANLARSSLEFASTMLVRGLTSSVFDIAINFQFVLLGTASGQVEAPFFHGLFSAGQMIGSGLGALLTRAHIDFVKQVSITAATLATAYLLHWPFIPNMDGAADTTTDQTSPDVDEGQRMEGSPRACQQKRQRGATVLLLCFVGLSCSVGEGALPEWAGIYLRQNLKTDFAVSNAAAFACAAGMTVARLLGSRAAERLGVKTVMMGGTLLAASAMAAGLLINRPTPLLVAVALAGAGLANVTPLSIALLSRLPDDEQAAAVTRISIAQQLGFFSGPPLIGTVSALIGLRWALSLVSLTCLAVFGLVVPLRLPTEATDRRRR